MEKLNNKFIIKNEIATISSDDFFECSKNKDKSLFVDELNNLLEDNGGNIKITHYSSNFMLEKLLDVLCIDDIEMIEVKLSENIYNNVSFFNLDIKLKSGTIKLIARWCLWKETRLTELVRGLLAPVYIAELQDRVLVNGEIIMFKQEVEVIQSLIAIAAEQIPGQFQDKYDSKINSYYMDLIFANVVGCSNLEELDIVPSMKNFSTLKQKIFGYEKAINA